MKVLESNIKAFEERKKMFENRIIKLCKTPTDEAFLQIKKCSDELHDVNIRLIYANEVLQNQLAWGESTNE